MKLEAPVKPSPPYEYQYRERTERKYIYSFTQIFNHEGDRDYDDEGEDFGNSEKEPHEVNLAWLLTQIPEGVSLDQIKMEFAYKASCMAYENHYVKFYYEATIPARTAELEAAKAQYASDLAIYEKNLAVYQQKIKEKEIADLEAKLAKLKK